MASPAHRHALEVALHELAALLEAQIPIGMLMLDEAGNSYYYDEAEEKRWILGDGGNAGNCDECEAAADEGWVDMDFTYSFEMGDVDEPPGHPYDTCEIEQRTRRYRVYESAAA